ncbi:DMT family transporter (plasmid) [Deinococcus taeanensis]|uniref:DMT family transporter n=1 Tax=Deinococcus taeanensis TaxID=2737050 RepID=UPI001CDD4888|nr:DMT family transporter [Deinococcus taeanensis]UBV45294.1 DMT family transporter [Deinococcus taeanensis]
MRQLSLPRRSLRPAVAPATPTRLLGWTALFVTVLIWAGFALTIRAIGASPLTSADVALIRFLVPGVLLLPVLRSRWAALKSAPRQAAALIVLGAGLPFFLLTAAGGTLTSAAHVSALVAGTTPLAVALVGFVLFRQKVAGHQWPGLAVIVAGVALLVAGLHLHGGAVLSGTLILLTSSLLWGGYTLGLRRAQLDPLTTAALVTYPALVCLVPLMASGALPSHLQQVSLGAVLPFVLVQGLGVGVVAALTYPYAIQSLGALRCAAFGALAPVLATVLAVPLLGEFPSARSAVGVLVVTAGVVLFNVLPARPAQERPHV